MTTLAFQSHRAVWWTFVAATMIVSFVQVALADRESRPSASTTA